MSVLAAIRIVLVEPAGALNVGSIARVMKNMGLQRLVLVDPHCDPLSPEAKQMAVHAIDVLEAAECVATLPAALQGCDRAMATTGRDRALDTVLETPRSGLPWLLAAPPPHQAALIFGPEDRGLSNTELNYAQRFIRIPSSPAYPSLNLAQAVAVCCYELYQSAIDSLPEGVAPAIPVPAPAELAAIETLEAYYQHLEAVLLRIGYLYPHTANSRMEKFRRVFNRSQLSAAEVAMLRGILNQMEWFVQQATDAEKH